MIGRSHGPRVVLFGLIGSGNIGNDGSFVTVLTWLRHHRPDAGVTCVTSHPDVLEATFGVPASRMRRASRSHGPAALRAVATVLDRVLDLARAFTVAARADVVVVPGMGVLEGSLGVRAWNFPLDLFFTAWACRLLRRAFVLLGVGAEPVPDRWVRLLFVWTVRACTYVSYRDELSRSAMARAGAEQCDGVTADLAFAYPDDVAARPQPGRVVVGVMAYYGYDDDRERGRAVHEVYLCRISEVVAGLVGAGRQVVLLGGDQVDYEVACEVRSRVQPLLASTHGCPVRAPRVQTFDEVSAEVAAAEVVVGSRYHTVVAALRLGRPTVSVGYSRKHRQLMESFGVGTVCQDIETLSPDLLMRQIDELGATASATSALIDAHALRARKQAEQLLDALGTMIPNYSGGTGGKE